MAVFEYKALTQQGKSVTGLQEGESERHVRQLLRDQALAPVSLKQIVKADKQASQRWFSAKLNVADLALFTRELYTLLTASTPLKEALKALSEQAESKVMKRFIGSLHTHVSEGYSLANALAMAPLTVPQEVIATIQAGEESGHLDKVLSRLADSVEQQDKLHKKMKTALIYPVLMVLVAVAIVFFLMVYVVPKVVVVFEQMQQDLPPLTQGLLMVSGFFQHYWYAVLLVILIAWVGIKWSLTKPTARFKIHRLLLRLPGIRRFLIYSATARWARTLGVLVLSGVPIKQALTISAEVMTLDPLKKAVDEMVNQVREGQSVSQAMQTAAFFPPLLINLVKTGEGNGQLDNMLIKGAEHYESAVENTASALVSILEPVLILVMGGVVLTIVLAIMMPLFEMNQMIS